MIKTYPIGVALSVASGKMLCDFPDLHNAITDLAGWPVMTHHLANEELVHGCATKVINQIPWAPSAIENMPTWSSTAPRDQVKAAILTWLARIAATHGDTVTIDTGDPLPALGVFDGLERLGAGR